jgi:hypothetical protein
MCSHRAPKVIRNKISITAASKAGSGHEHQVLRAVIVDCCIQKTRSTEPVFVNLFGSPGIDPSLAMAGTTTLFDVPARQATKAGGIDSLESIPGLLRRLQIRAL